MNDKIEAFKIRIQQLTADGKCSPEAAALIDDMVVELEAAYKQNLNLRKTALKAVSKQDRMSSRLKDALME
ncbi:hypothetical protein BBD41_04470 [Paenibacillus ihbetae]|uniref:Uncharacterized protein n=1 Tax=Paenibacillus ihbetae TaxID=1870820 RepID=A0A1B2DW11_9BACL|nr:hypothetical protein [Paenibacillus ihbetae]ANY71898.1 hypothetical protein BBD41_04470 [Paenibacillus ihbetae]